MVIDRRFIYPEEQIEAQIARAYSGFIAGEKSDVGESIEGFEEAQRFFDYVLANGPAALAPDEMDLKGDYHAHLYYFRQRQEADAEVFGEFIGKIRAYLFTRLDEVYKGDYRSLYHLDHVLVDEEDDIESKLNDINESFNANDTVFDYWNQYDFDLLWAGLNNDIQLSVWLIINFDFGDLPGLFLKMPDPIIWSSLMIYDAVKCDWDVLLSFVRSADLRLASLGVLFYVALLMRLPEYEKRKTKDDLLETFSPIRRRPAREAGTPSLDLTECYGIVERTSSTLEECESRISELNIAIFEKPKEDVVLLYDGLIRNGWPRIPDSSLTDIRDLTYVDFTRRIEGTGNADLLNPLLEQTRGDKGVLIPAVAYYWALSIAAMEDVEALGDFSFKKVLDSLGDYYKYYTQLTSDASTSELGFGYRYQLDFVNTAVRYFFAEVRLNGLGFIDGQLEDLKSDLGVFTSPIGRSVIAGLSDEDTPYAPLLEAYARLSFRVWLLWWTILSKDHFTEGPLLGDNVDNYSQSLIAVTKDFVNEGLWTSVRWKDDILPSLIRDLSTSELFAGNSKDYLDSLIYNAQSIKDLLLAKTYITKDALGKSTSLDHDRIKSRLSELFVTDLRELHGEDVLYIPYAFGLLSASDKYDTVLDEMCGIRGDFPIKKEDINKVVKAFREYPEGPNADDERLLTEFLIKSEPRDNQQYYYVFCSQLGDVYGLDAIRDMFELLI